MKAIGLSKTILLFSLIFSMAIFCSCKNEKTDSQAKSDPSSQNNNTGNSESNTNAEVDIKSIGSNEKLYAWVDKLNIRSTSDRKGKIITTVQSSDALEFTGKKSGESETIVLRGVAYHDKWLEIKTPDGKIGWVFGGAVKQKNETKGNAPLQESSFEFQHFGKYNLNDWKNQGTKDESGGDAEIKTTTFTKALKKLEISQVDVGDYGYGTVHKLYNDDKLIRVRKFNFLSDVDYRELVEIIEDYTKNPLKKYTRTQKLDKHPSQLNGKPIMVIGEWEESIITQ